MMAGRFEVYQDAGNYRWVLKAGSGHVVASGQGFASRDEAIKGSQAVRSAAEAAEIFAEVADDASDTERVVSRVNSASKLIKIEETGASLPEAQ